MSEENESGDRAAEIRVVLEEYLRRRDSASPVDETAVVQAHPDLMPDLDKELRKIRFIDRARRDAENATHLADSSDADLPIAFGRYRVQRLLHEGGFGTVYVAHDIQLDRAVAIKVPRQDRLAPSERTEQFQQEARRVARLKHPGIVTVHDVGVQDGQCYIVSDLVQGVSLHDWLDSHRPSWEDAARIAAAVADALAYAHSQHIIHRDVKPSNILLAQDLNPVLVDFGLAFTEEEATGLEPGRVAGTLAYMSPEQARGEVHRIDRQTDIYSLGVVLYQMLCGRLPFRSQDPKELLRQVCEDDPQPLRRWVPQLPVGLERACLKALAKRVNERYATASDMAEDMRLIVATLPTETRPAHTASTLRQETASSSSPAQFSRRVIPRGLRSFGPDDSEFFLELLPGVRDRDGLPESIAFWKKRIECRHANAAFAVGLIYGPSGCGKSSLLRAGLLPRLADFVLPVSIEATRDGTEALLTRALSAAVPELDSGLGLRETFALLSRGKCLPGGRKVLIVLDQFEQWLHAHARDLEKAELVAAMRQAEGVHVQVLLSTRDDFWMSITRLFQSLEIKADLESNTWPIDLFDQRHARRVLELFGQAYGCLPSATADMSHGQTDFLDRAVAELGQDGRIIPVRLSLLADLMRGRSWTPASLAAVGGTEGVGLRFLEETFTARSALPDRRGLQEQVRTLLQMLLPEHGTEIKGKMRSRRELAAACELPDDSAPFARLIEILDRELHLITPTEEGHVIGNQVIGNRLTPAESSRARDGSPITDHPITDSYQLTHDYLVPSLRQWLTQEQRKTWRGRATLTLEDRAAEWGRTRETRFLPSLAEYVSAMLAVPRRNWKPKQREMMKVSTLRYGAFAALFALAATVLWWAGWEANGRIHSRELVKAIVRAHPAGLEKLIEQDLPPYRRWANPLLAAKARDADAEIAEKLRASLALVSVDPTQVDYLKDRLLDCSLDEFPVVRRSLRAHGAVLEKSLWLVLHDRERTAQARFRAGMALADFAPRSTSWSGDDLSSVAQQLVKSNPDQQRDTRRLLESLYERLLDPLENIFLDTMARDTIRDASANALADFARDDSARLARLASDATAEQYDILYPALLAAERSGSTAQDALSALVREEPTGKFSEAERVRLGQRRAGAAIHLMRGQHPQAALNVFRFRDDPEALTQFVHRLRDRHLEPTVLIECLDTAREEQVLFGLLSALGEFQLKDLKQAQQDWLTRRLVEWYRDDPRSAIHGVSGWLLRRWGMADEASRVDRTPMAFDPSGKRPWFVRQVGDDCITFVVFPSGQLAMGSPPTEQGRVASDETPHDVRITKPFAVSDREVTQQQWREFLLATHRTQDSDREFGPTVEHPANSVSWYLAVEYCRWLTEQAGMSETDQCYENPTELETRTLPDGSLVPKDWRLRIERAGFRLPTDAEWEFACRGGTSTAYGFGNDRALLRHYACFQDNSDRTTRAVGSLRPNLRGLFDMHGNILEWCHDWWDPKQRVPAGQFDAVLSDGEYRILRGGGWHSVPMLCRSAYRSPYMPLDRSPWLGFRVAVSLELATDDRDAKR